MQEAETLTIEAFSRLHFPVPEHISSDVEYVVSSPVGGSPECSSVSYCW